MPTALDLAIDSTVTRLMENDGPLSVTHVEKYGVQIPMIAKAPENLRDYFAMFCALNADKEFLVDGDLRLTFAECHAAALALAGGLNEGYGLQVGDRVGIAARNSANWIIAYMAILISGGVATLLNGWWQGSELADGIRMVGCKYVLADAQRAARLQGEDVGSAELLIFEHDCHPLEGLQVLLAKGGNVSTALPPIDPLDPATILYTSGSTGQSKGAWSDHRAVVQGAMSYVGQTLVFFEILASTGEAPTMQPATLLNVPLFHVTAAVPVLLQSFVIGRKLVMMPKWDAEHAMQLIEKEKITYFVGVPLMSIEIATHPNRLKYDLTSCTAFAAGGAPRPVEHVKRIKQEMEWGFPLLGYGLTETNGVGCGNFTDNYLAKPSSTGPATKPLVDLAILDDDGNKMPQGERGEVCIRSIANFNGYWENEEATHAAFTSDGYFRTGDIGYLDEDGYLFIVDRKKDIIIRGGENISCPEVEAAAYEHDAVAELSVFGIADDRYGEVPGLVYFTKVGSELSPDELKSFLQAKLAPFKVPVHFWRVHEPLPRLGTQKIDRVTLRREYNTKVKELED
ncbi:class I adenylate-forming enzyme family protein [uncultured Sphingorhabdus sp.]|uniref:class I adenylate-forming enzyme family protein n=1 Tax=uncultured Sphingorhabdus sp. TaxID=1686106 RepID=UPI0026163767|nr:class I adenylate-forming enzyme family protein [uncultured Sphingorhabdus sp.]HMS20891.1 class I adenylate-forming enzyme family protein [Sphingorhabdus sp.]